MERSLSQRDFRAWLRLSRLHLSLQTIAPIIAVILLVVIGGFLSPVFLTLSNIQSIAISASVLILLAVGQTFVISTGGIDLSVASIAQLSGVVLALVSIKAGMGDLGIVAALLAGALAGLINGILVNKLGVSDFIVTLGTFSVLTGVTLVISNATPVVLTSSTLSTLATGKLFGISLMVVFALAFAVLAHLVLLRSAFGTHVLAVGGNRGAAEAVGLHVSRIKVAVYMISGTMAAAGGIFMASRLGAAEPTAGSAYQLTSIAAVVLGGVSLFGGRSNILGPVCGAFVLTGIVNLLTILRVPVFYQPIAVGIVVLAAAYLGKFSRK